MTGSLLLVLATALVVAATLPLVRLAAAERGWEAAVAGGIIGLAEITVLSWVVGAFGAYDATWLVVGAAVVAAAAGLAMGRAARRPPQPRRAPERLGLAWWQLALAATGALALAWRLLFALVLPPFAYDALTYHLTAVATWIRTGHVAANAYSYCCARYPSNGELLHGWLAVFPRVDTLADASQIATAALGAAAVGALARFAGVSRAGAFAAAGLFLATPIVLTQANTPYVDVTFASYVLAALALVARGFHPVVRPALVVLGGVAAGLALGSKQFGLAVAVVLVVLVAANAVAAARHGRLPRRAALTVVVAFAVCCAALGSYWYVRSAVATGDPVYPATVQVGSVSIFHGRTHLGDLLTVPPGGRAAWWYEVARSWFHDLAFWTRRDYSYEERDGGLGPVWSWLGWGAVLALAWWSIRRRPSVAANVVAPIAVLFAVQPYRWWSRFTIYLPALGAIALVHGLERLAPGRRRTVVAAATVGLACIGIALASWRVDPAARGATVSATRVLGLVGSPARDRTIGRLFYPEYRWLDDVPPRAPVAVAQFATPIRFVYPFLAPRFQRRVVLLAGQPGPRLVRQLAAAHAAFLAVAAGGVYDRWARTLPGRVRWRGDGIVVYSLRP